MRPFVEKGQGVPKLAPKLMNPKTRFGIRLLHGALKVASKPAIRRVSARLFAGGPETIDLSGYGGRPT